MARRILNALTRSLSKAENLLMIAGNGSKLRRTPEFTSIMERMRAFDKTSFKFWRKGTVAYTQETNFRWTRIIQSSKLIWANITDNLAHFWYLVLDAQDACFDCKREWNPSLFTLIITFQKLRFQVIITIKSHPEVTIKMAIEHRNPVFSDKK